MDKKKLKSTILENNNGNEQFTESIFYKKNKRKKLKIEEISYGNVRFTGSKLEIRRICTYRLQVFRIN